jgi:hypothetical protein
LFTRKRSEEFALLTTAAWKAQQEVPMFAVRMLQLIESHADKLSRELIHKLESSGNSRELIKRVPAQELKMRTHEIYRNLSDWLVSKTQSEIEERYEGLGMRREKQGVPFSELLFAFTATKECLWEYLEQDGLFEDPMELIGDLTLLHSIGRFFDRVAHAAAVGYEGAHARKHSDLACTSADG